MARVIVVGAGVVGLTSAVRLAEAGHRVDVVGRDLPHETTSAVAAAVWYPYLALPPDRVDAWGARSYDVFAVLAADPATGVRMLPGTVDGRAVTAPVVDMPFYLDWLVARLSDLGGTLTRLNLAALPATGGAGADLVIDCAGLGTRLLAADQTVVPVRGQVVVVEQIGLEEWFLATSGSAPTYVVPRRDEIVLGGTEEHGEWSRTPDPETAQEILARATALAPALAGAKVLRHKVGLRPARPSVRLEREGDVIHCYGHGGAGVTLSWGCADEVADLVG